MPPERLQKIIAAAGVASRRKAEEMITSGRVQINGKIVTELGTKADPETDHIRVDGKLLQGPERHTYIVLNKPKGYVTTVSDPENRPTVMDLVGGAKGRVYPVGRLDWASEGLLVLTNDGALANALMKASSNVPKTYVVKVAGQPDNTKLDKLRAGVSIAEKGGRRVRTAPARIRLIREADNPWLEVTIIEGRNRQVRKMFEEVGHHVEKIRRVKYGPLSLDVPPGEFRSLTLEEVSRLKSAAAGAKMGHVPRPEMATSEQPQAVKSADVKPTKDFGRRFAGAARRPEMPRSERPQALKPRRNFGGRSAGAPRRSEPQRSERPRDLKPTRDFGRRSVGAPRPETRGSERPRALKPTKDFGRRGAGLPRPEMPRSERPQGPRLPRDFARRSAGAPRPEMPRSERPQGPKPPRDRSAGAPRHAGAKNFKRVDKRGNQTPRDRAPFNRARVDRAPDERAPIDGTQGERPSKPKVGEWRRSNSPSPAPGASKRAFDRQRPKSQDRRAGSQDGRPRSQNRRPSRNSPRRPR
jgi:23S rRNA pseudouridine2605 synthase